MQFLWTHEYLYFVLYTWDFIGEGGGGGVLK